MNKEGKRRKTKLVACTALWTLSKQSLMQSLVFLNSSENKSSTSTKNKTVTQHLKLLEAIKHLGETKQPIAFAS